ncbi:MAG: hypothetical protein ABL869_05375 [Candidatus Nitrotoga sp.]
MSKAKELLLECKIRLGVKTDYKLAQALQIHSGLVSDYMREKRTPDTFTCVQMALVLKRDPAEIIAIVESESEKNEKRKTFWLDFLQRVRQASRAGTLGLIFIVGLLGGGQNLKPESGFFRKRHFA